MDLREILLDIMVKLSTDWWINLIIAGLVAAFAAFNKNRRFFYGLGAFAFMIIILDMKVSDLWKDPPPAPPSIEKRIHSFMTVPGYKIEKLKPGKNLFQLEVTVANTKMFIFVQKENERVIAISGEITISPEARKIYSALDKNEQIKFQSRLELELLKLGNIEYRINMPKGAILLIKYIYYDETLSQHDFLQSVFDVQNAIKTTDAVFTINFGIKHAVRT